MKSTLLLGLIFACALGAQPSVWDNGTCPSAAEYDNYIILGEDALEGQFPYMLSLKFKDNKRHACSASILTSKWALTAGHCCSTGYDMHLCSGSNSLLNGGKEHRIETMKVHNDFQPSDYWKNDICLIKVKDPFILREKVQKITLPTQGYLVEGGDLLTVTGWGYTEPGKYGIPDKLQVGKNFVTLSAKDCTTHTGHYRSSYLCVLGDKTGQGVCNGDSGSPIVKKGVQVGIASWAYKPCGCGRPDIYTRVPMFINWIKKILGRDASELKFMK